MLSFYGSLDRVQPYGRDVRNVKERFVVMMESNVLKVNPPPNYFRVWGRGVAYAPSPFYILYGEGYWGLCDMIKFFNAPKIHVAHLPDHIILGLSIPGMGIAGDEI